MVGAPAHIRKLWAEFKFGLAGWSNVNVDVDVGSKEEDGAVIMRILHFFTLLL